MSHDISDNSSLDKSDISIPKTAFSQIPVYVAIGSSLLLLLLTFALSSVFHMGGIESVLMSFAVGIVALLAIFKPRLIFFGYISICMIFPHELEETFIPLGFMKFYPQDALFAYMLIVCVFRILFSRASLHSLDYNKWMFVYLLLGVWAAGVGLLITHNDYNNVFGDFRRSFFYFLAYFFVLLMIDKPQDLIYIKAALAIGTIGIVIRSAVLVTLGDFVTRRFGDAAHIMNHFEVTFATLAVFAGLAKLSLGTRRPTLWILAAICGLFVVMVGNFRTCWIGLFGGLAVLIYFLPHSQRRRLSFILMLFFALGSVTLAVVWDVPVEITHSTIGENIEAKANLKQTEYDPNVVWRIDSYENAFELWKSQPIIGRGLGEELEFATVTSTGQPIMAIGHRVHNSYLWFLMSLGVSGFLLLLMIQGRFVYIVMRVLRDQNISKQTRTTLTVSIAFYTTILICAFFDVYLESPPPITMISVIMALSLLTISYDPMVKKSCSAVPV